MTIHVNRQQAQQQFQQLFSQVLKGEEIVITSNGEEMARLVPATAYKQPDPAKPAVRVPGIDKGRFIVPDDFDNPLPADILAAFEGGN